MTYTEFENFINEHISLDGVYTEKELIERISKLSEDEQKRLDGKLKYKARFINTFGEQKWWKDSTDAIFRKHLETAAESAKSEYTTQKSTEIKNAKSKVELDTIYSDIQSTSEWRGIKLDNKGELQNMITEKRKEFVNYDELTSKIRSASNWRELQTIDVTQTDLGVDKVQKALSQKNKELRPQYERYQQLRDMSNRTPEQDVELEELRNKV